MFNELKWNMLFFLTLKLFGKPGLRYRGTCSNVWAQRYPQINLQNVANYSDSFLACFFSCSFCLQLSMANKTVNFLLLQ